MSTTTTIKKLVNHTINFIDSNKDSYIAPTFYDYGMDLPIERDLNMIKEFIVINQNKIVFSIAENSINFDFKYPMMKGGMPELFESSEKSFELELKSKNLFWESSKVQNEFHNICQFKSFNDTTVHKDRFLYELLKYPCFNFDEWLKYYKRIIEISLPEFNQELVNEKANYIRYKPFKDNWFIGIKTSFSKTKRELKNGQWETPIIDLFVFKKDKNSITETINLGRAVHPIFKNPVTPFGGYFACIVNNDLERKYIDVYEMFQKEIIENDFYLIHFSEDLGEELKRHSFYYFSVQTTFLENYIDFISIEFDELLNLL